MRESVSLVSGASTCMPFDATVSYKAGGFADDEGCCDQQPSQEVASRDLCLIVLQARFLHLCNLKSGQ